MTSENQKKPIKSGVCLDWLEFTVFQRRPDTFCDDMPAHRIQLTDDKRRQLLFEPDEDDLPDSDPQGCLFGPPESWVYEFRRREDLNQQERPFDLIFVTSLLGRLGREPALKKGGALGYRSLYLTACGVSILSDGSDGMGVHVTISGKACNYIEDPAALVSALIWEGAKFSRLDVAVDDCDKKLNLKKMIKKAKKGQCITRLKRASVIEGFLLKDGSLTGLTLYLGRRGSDFMARCYDKFLEQVFEHGVDPETIPGHWIRFEAETRGEAATNVAKLIASGLPIPAVAMGIFSNYFSFRDDNGDLNRSRWPVCSWWSKWLGGVDKLRIAKTVAESSIEKRLKWVKRQCPASLAILTAAGKSAEIKDAISSAFLTLTEKQQKEILSYQERGKAAAAELKNTNKYSMNQFSRRYLLSSRPKEKQNEMSTMFKSPDFRRKIFSLYSPA